MTDTSIEFLISTAEQHDLFGDFLPATYATEAHRRWSGSPQWTQAAERIEDYGLIEWQEIRAEQEDWERRLVRLVTDQLPATGEAAMDLAEEQRRAIDAWFHTCSADHHLAMTRALLSDASWRTRYDGLATGTADFLAAAVAANTARHHLSVDFGLSRRVSFDPPRARRPRPPTKPEESACHAPRSLGPKPVRTAPHHGTASPVPGRRVASRSLPTT